MMNKNTANSSAWSRLAQAGSVAVMSFDRDGLVEQIGAATERLLTSVRQMPDSDMGRSSLLPGWTRGHVLTHVARTGDAMCNLLAWARTGAETAAYQSAHARAADIEAGAGRGSAELLADVTATAAAFAAAAGALPDSAWRVRVWVLGGAEFPAGQVLVRRLVEVELHHTDLDVGYGPGDWPTSFAEMELPEPMLSQRKDRMNRAS